MLFRQAFLDGIRAGAVTLAFRRWRRPTVSAGGTLLTPVGELRIGPIACVGIDEISDADARRAGYASRDTLVAELARRADGELYRTRAASDRTGGRRAAAARSTPDPTQRSGVA